MVAIGIALIVQRPQVGFGREIRIEREDAPRVHGRSRHVVRHGERGGQKGVVELVRMADMFECVDRFAIAGPPDHCVARLNALKALGLDRVAISGGTRGADAGHAETARELMRREVLPAMRNARPG